MNTRCRSLPIAVAIFVSIFTISCSTTIDSGSDKQYQLKRVLNYWEVHVNGSLSDVHEAVINGVKDMQIKPYSHADSITAMVEGKFADQSDFTIKLTEDSPDVVTMRLRVGIKGDKVRTERLFHAIQRHFPKARFSM